MIRIVTTHNISKFFLWYLGQIFVLVDLRDFFSDLGSGDKKINKKALKMTRKKNSKTSEVNFNLYIFHHFPKNLDRTITFNSVTLKNTKTEPKKYHFFTKQIIFRVGR